MTRIANSRGLLLVLATSCASGPRQPSHPVAVSHPSLSPVESAEQEDSRVYKVPVGSSPVLGLSNALVTIVVFTDFQCPFCKLANESIADLRKEYGHQIRIVFKHAPSPRHPRAEPASQLAIEARVEQGDPGFWKAHDALFTSAPALSDADLAAIATSLALSPSAVDAAIRSRKHISTIQSDLELADQLAIDATPTFFINGRRLVGALPPEAFHPLISQGLAEAQARIRDGVPPDRVYEDLVRNGVTSH